MSSPNIHKVAVSGVSLPHPHPDNELMVPKANGSMGPTVLKRLIEEGYDVLVLTTDREKTLSSLPKADNAQVVQAQYTIEELVPILRGRDAVISLISRVHAEPRNVLADAAVAAGVYRIIPSYFGIDMRRPGIRSNLALQSKVVVEDHINELVAKNKITYTGIVTSAFLDWALERGMFVNIHGGVTAVISGGEIHTAMTSYADIAKAIISVLRKPAETENKYLCIQSIATTENELVAIAKEALPDLDMNTVAINSQDMYDASKAAYDRGERSPDALRGFLLHGTYGQGYGDHVTNDNELLGIQELSKEQLQEIMRAHHQRGQK